MTRWKPLVVTWELVNKTIERFSRDRGDLLSAALAFYALLSIAPLIIVAIAIAGIILGRGAAQAEVSRLLGETLGEKNASTVNEWVRQASEGGEVASIIGIGLTLLAASRFVNQLRSALNLIWKVDVYMAESFKASVRDYLQRRVFAFAVTLAAGPLLLVVVASRTVLSALPTSVFGQSAWNSVVAQVTQLAVALVAVALTSAVVFRHMPDTRIAWKNALVGGAVTSVLFNLGNALVGLYLSKTAAVAAYGAAGSLVVVLLWLHFSAQMFLFGAEFTRVYAERYGSALSVQEQSELASAQASAVRERSAHRPIADPFIVESRAPGGPDAAGAPSVPGPAGPGAKP
jgi:membrane protein